MKKLIIMSGLFLCALTALIWVAVVDASIPVVMIRELKEDKLPSGNIQLDDGRIVAIQSHAPLRFSVAHDSDPSFVVEVQSQRSPPENFKAGVKVSLRGEYHRAENIFVAYKISTQCPSRYEASRDVREGNSQAKAPPGTGTRIE